MADSVSVSGPVHVQSDSRHRVALELTQLIAQYEGDQTAMQKRDYWLRLYWQCMKAATSSNLESILKGD